jgi:hypothetical protein
VQPVKRARKRARAIQRPIGRMGPVNMIASFGMILSLLCMWAMTVPH